MEPRNSNLLPEDQDGYPIVPDFCPECRCNYDHLEQKVIPLHQLGTWHSWIVLTKCPQGHELRQEEHEAHFHFDRKTS